MRIQSSAVIFSKIKHIVSERGVRVYRGVLTSRRCPDIFAAEPHGHWVLQRYLFIGFQDRAISKHDKDTNTPVRSIPYIILLLMRSTRPRFAIHVVPEDFATEG
jgi:hypothetical protein